MTVTPLTHYHTTHNRQGHTLPLTTLSGTEANIASILRAGAVRLKDILPRNAGRALALDAAGECIAPAAKILQQAPLWVEEDFGPLRERLATPLVVPGRIASDGPLPLVAGTGGRHFLLAQGAWTDDIAVRHPCACIVLLSGVHSLI